MFPFSDKISSQEILNLFHDRVLPLLVNDGSSIVFKSKSVSTTHYDHVNDDSDIYVPLPGDSFAIQTSYSRLFKKTVYL